MDLIRHRSPLWRREHICPGASLTDLLIASALWFDPNHGGRANGSGGRLRLRRHGRGYARRRRPTRGSPRWSMRRSATRGRCSTSAPARAPTSPTTATSWRSSRRPRCAPSDRRAPRRRWTATAERAALRRRRLRRGDGEVTVHQWRDLAGGLRELRRVARGPVVVLTFDGDALDRLWLAEYAPELIAAERRRYPAIATIARGARRHHRRARGADPDRLRRRLHRGVLRAARGVPRPAVRAAQSAGASSRRRDDRAVAGSRADLAPARGTGATARCATQPTFVGSMRLIVAQPDDA